MIYQPAGDPVVVSRTVCRPGYDWSMGDEGCTSPSRSLGVCISHCQIVSTCDTAVCGPPPPRGEQTAAAMVSEMLKHPDSLLHIPSPTVFLSIFFLFFYFPLKVDPRQKDLRLVSSSGGSWPTHAGLFWETHTGREGEGVLLSRAL